MRENSFIESIEFCENGYNVSPLLFGGNLEHSRSAVNGGISAQMLRNRKFAGMPNSFLGNADEWFIIGDKTFGMVGYDRTVEGNINLEKSLNSYTRHSDIGNHMYRLFECNSQTVRNIYGGLSGIGQDKIYIKANEEYEFRIVLRTDREVKLNVSLTSHNGEKVYDSKTVCIKDNEWKTYICLLKPNTTDYDADLRITFTETAKIMIGAISLMNNDNFHGMRKDVIERLKEMNIKMLRWPGGNFAGEYNWFDGLLPCDMRAPLESHIHHLTQPHTLGFDFHEINTDDFIALCREIGAEPSITLNLTWNTPEENAFWVEYCNGDETTEYGKLRIERGFKEPYNVKYWSLGNEFGYGHMEGDNTAAGYLKLAKENADAMLKVDSKLILCTSGYHPNREWAKVVSNSLADVAPMAALHNYVNYPIYADAANKKQELLSALEGVDECRRKIYELRSYLSPDVAIAFDEWNCWYSWNRPKDTFAGILVARMLHMFIQEQQNSNVPISSYYQPVNEGGICVCPDKAELTPVGKVFGIISQHSGGQILYVSDLAVVSKKNGIITVTLINDSYDTEKVFTLNHNGEADGVQLYAEDIGPHTDFFEKEIKIKSNNGLLNITVPSISITLLKIADE